MTTSEAPELTPLAPDGPEPATEPVPPDASGTVEVTEPTTYSRRGRWINHWDPDD